MSLPAQQPSCVSIAFYFLVFILGIGTPSHVEAFAARRGCARQLSNASSGHTPLDRSTAATSHRRLSNNDDDYDPRDNLGRTIRGVQSLTLKTEVEVGDTVVCKRAVERLNIYENASYEVKSIYTQSFDEETQQTVKEPLSSLAEAETTNPNQSVYLTLFSPEHHAEAVIVTAEEVGLVTVREELGNVVWLAVPGFFWILVAGFP
jgi:hypothetical protein